MQYARELREYQKSEAYQITCAKVQDKRIKRGENVNFLVLVLFLFFSPFLFAFAFLQYAVICN